MKNIFLVFISLIIILILSACGDGSGGGTIINYPPTVSSLVSPLDAEQTTLPILNWSVSALATAYDIKLWKSTDSEEYLVQNLTNTSYSIKTPLDNSSLYYWKVIAKNAFGSVESDKGEFSTSPRKSGNYIEIRDVRTNINGSFTLVIAGSIINARAIQLVLNFNDSEIELAPNGSSDVEINEQNLPDALFITTTENNMISIDISNMDDFTLNNQEILRITCDAKSLQGVFQVTIDNTSMILDGNFSQINFDPSDIGYVFVR